MVGKHLKDGEHLDDIVGSTFITFTLAEWIHNELIKHASYFCQLLTFVYCSFTKVNNGYEHYQRRRTFVVVC